MHDDKRYYPRLGECLAVCLEVVGYRLPPDTTVASVGREVFRCDPAGLTKRFKGATQVASAQLSTLIAKIGLDAEGISPLDFRLTPDDLRQKMQENQMGIYGRSASTRLLRAVKAFEGETASIQIIREARRNSAFSSNPDANDWIETRVYRPREKIRIRCNGPAECRLLLLDHAADGPNAGLLSPREPGEWALADNSGSCHIPDTMEPPLSVISLEGTRNLTALWVDPDFGKALDNRLAHAPGNPLDDAPDPPEFRNLNATELAALTELLKSENPQSICAAATLKFRVEQVSHVSF